MSTDEKSKQSKLIGEAEGTNPDMIVRLLSDISPKAPDLNTPLKSSLESLLKALGAQIELLRDDSDDFPKEESRERSHHNRLLNMLSLLNQDFYSTNNDHIDENAKYNDIKKIDYSFSEDAIRSLVELALTPLLERTNLRAEQKTAIIDASSTAFKSCVDDNNGVVGSEGKQSSWIERIGGQTKTGETSGLPVTAPAIWKDGKLANDTPPDFIKRQYGPWLKADATGLTRPDIKRLDPSLYMALANWLRKNELPDDCPVPIKSERVNADLGRFLEGGIGAVVDGAASPEDVLRESRRISSAIQRRR